MINVFWNEPWTFSSSAWAQTTSCWETREACKHGPASRPFDLEQTIRAGQHGVHDDSGRPVTPRQSSREQCATIILWPVAPTINWPHTQVLAKGWQRAYYAWPPIWMLARRTPPATGNWPLATGHWTLACVCSPINLSLEPSQGSSFDMHKHQKGKIIICPPLEHL